MKVLIISLAAVCLMSLAAMIYLSYMLFITNEELREMERKNLETLEPVKWDYTKETGWVDADVEEL